MKKIGLISLIIVCICGISGWYLMRPDPSVQVSFVSVTKNELPSEAVSLFNESRALVYDVYRSEDGQHHYLRFKCGNQALMLRDIKESDEKTMLYVAPVSKSVCKEMFFNVSQIQDEIEVLYEKK